MDKEYEPDQQQTQQPDSDEESFHTAQSNISEELLKPGKRPYGSVDSGVGESMIGRGSFSSSCCGSIRDRGYDSGVCVCVCVCACACVRACACMGG